MDAYILDLDGTLMPSHEVDNDCYWQAVEAVFETPARVHDLQAYTHVTDMGILSQWGRERLGREPTANEVEDVRELFLRYLQEVARNDPRHFEPTPGVEAWLARLAGECSLAIATGGWAKTAQFKLEKSGLARFELPLSSADDATSRENIMRHAQGRLAVGAMAGSITYVGDGPWDLRAAQQLGWAFIGIARGQRAATLRAAGADRVFADFQDSRL